MTDFASALAERIRSHDSFWEDYRSVRALGAVSTLKLVADPKPASSPEAVRRLLFAASVLAQSSDEQDHAISQAIALSALLATDSTEILGTAKTLLAHLGNFPGVHYLQQHFIQNEVGVIADLQIGLLEVLNTVRIAEGDRALTNFQLDVWTALPSLSVASISAPTSAGKSFVVIDYMCKQGNQREDFVGVYVTPTQALLGEVSKKIVSRTSEYADFLVSTVPTVSAKRVGRQIYVLTQERLAALLVETELSPSLLVVDEAQNLADGARGIILQDCIERVRDRNKSAQIILLSPNTTGLPQALETLGIDHAVVKETSLSPVLQNRIVVHAVPGQTHKLRLSLLEKGIETEMGTFVTERGIDSADTRLATVALEFGAGGGALVYATGPADSEKTALRLVLGLSPEESGALAELSEFIRAHIHQEYGLAKTVMYGVAFHYGKMPALLREALESAFEHGHVKYLVCTTTLFQGVNLPARNVFINTPTRGNGAKLPSALLWNFAGRAGRLSKDVVGNVFLVDYGSWPDRPLDKLVKLEVKTSLSTIMTNHLDLIVEALSGAMPKQSKRDETASEISAAAGFLLARAARGSVRQAVDRLPSLSTEQKEEVISAAIDAHEKLGLPASVLEGNWIIDPYGLSRLKASLFQKLQQDLLDDFIPCDPSEARAFGVYAGVFNLIAREVWGWDATRLGAFVANYALLWMKGVPYPVLISKWVKYKSKISGAPTNVDSLIRGAFDFIEDELRFKWVQHSRAYVDVLKHVLVLGNRSDLLVGIYDFSLALELGVSSKSARSFIELGLSRITASVLASLFPDSRLSTDDALATLAKLDLALLKESPIVVREIEELRKRTALESVNG